MNMMKIEFVFTQYCVPPKHTWDIENQPENPAMEHQMTYISWLSHVCTLYIKVWIFRHDKFPDVPSPEKKELTIVGNPLAWKESLHDIFIGGS